ncbi:MAG: CAP domain-containing protein, partial [Actinomycetota bacterium]|nr:CAP domain-containing protein [Actinomycetota bacterium]
PSGNGYWLVASDGGIFSFGDAKFQGSTGAIRLNSPIVGMAGTPSGNGYWLVAADGGIFGFGDAKFYGGMAGKALVSPITGIAATGDGGGYWMVAEDGGIFTFGTAKFLGAATGAPPQTTVDIAPSPAGGYFMATTFGAVHVANENGVFLVDPNLAGRNPAESIATELVARINAERRARNMAPVTWHPQLADAARGWAQQLADTNGFSHQDLNALINSYGGSHIYLAENIYTGTGGASDSGSAHAALMRSDPHRTTMLTPQLQYIGIGVVCVGNKVVVVEDFSIGAGAPTPASHPTPPVTPFVSADETGTACG